MPLYIKISFSFSFNTDILDSSTVSSKDFKQDWEGYVRECVCVCVYACVHVCVSMCLQATILAAHLATIAMCYFDEIS